jgi:hypothetical protein|tara:strand:+ start:669 stop:935 length:267 start_codon:yes stop_codon:yes gene_type:complete
MGRKKLYSEDLAIKIHDLRSEGKTMRQIGEIVGMHESKVRYVIYKVKPFKYRKLFKDLKSAMDEVDEKNNKMKKLLQNVQKKLLRRFK